MGVVTELLEGYGLVQDRDSLSIHEFPEKTIRRFHQQLYSTILGEQSKAQVNSDRSSGIDPFSFVAGRSIRADAGCGELPCRLEKLDFLGRYAALYANRVILPLPLQDPAKVKHKEEAANQLLNSSFAILRLRPLVDAGLVFPVTMRSFHSCEHSLAWATETIEVMHAAADDAAAHFKDAFTVKYQLPEKSPTGLPSVYVEGPEDFLEHGELVARFDEHRNWRLKSWRYDNNGMVELRGWRKLFFIKTIFTGIADDTSFYLTYGRDNNARYLSSQKGETLLLDLVTEQDEELSASSQAISAFMAHTLPLLGDLPLGALLRIRKQERDSFGRYREAIGRVLLDVAARKKRVGKKEIQEIFRQQIEPQLVRIKSEMRQERSRQVRKTLGGAGALAVSVALGAIGQILPAASAVAVGVHLLKEAAKSKCDHGPTLKEKKDFYFLLRLAQEAEAAN
jgi:hypothetical protein